MKHLIASACLAIGLAGSAESAVIGTLQEAENNTVEFSIRVTNPAGFDYSGFDAAHLDYIFFDNLGDFINGPVLGNNNPTIFQPVTHGMVGTSLDGFTIGIQAIALDNDDHVPGDEDDFVIRFIGQTSGLINGQSPLNLATLVD
ncbi:MAG: hypothetical protein AAF501_05560 [Pseudomonadota bacterium]